jgi:hypothetical protein
LQDFLLSCFLALLGKLLFAFFGMNENVVRIAEMLFPFLAGFAEAAPIVKFKLVQLFEKFLVEFGLQFKSKIRKQFCRF